MTDTLADIWALSNALDAKPMRVYRCPSCGTWGGFAYLCVRCQVYAVPQGEYLTRIVSGPQPARLTLGEP